ncbi:MAG: hypothetical protein ACTHMW_09435, partial [Actinomycetes bacterium]
RPTGLAPGAALRRPRGAVLHEQSDAVSISAVSAVLAALAARAVWAARAARAVWAARAAGAGRSDVSQQQASGSVPSPVPVAELAVDPAITVAAHTPVLSRRPGPGALAAAA